MSSLDPKGDRRLHSAGTNHGRTILRADAPDPDKVNGEEVLKELPEGNRRIRIVKGGLRFPPEGTPEEAKTHGITIVNAVIVVLVDVEKVPRR